MPDMLNTNEADWRNADREMIRQFWFDGKRTFSVVTFFGNINSFRHRQFPLFFKCTYIFSSELKVNDACRLNIHKRSCRQAKCTNSFTVEFDRSKFLALIDFLISSSDSRQCLLTFCQYHDMIGHFKSIIFSFGSLGCP